MLVVVEQVPGDASIRFGGGDITDNLAFLAAVRAQAPQAFIAYKEHPDLVSGNRMGRQPQSALLGHADRVISAGDLETVYRQADRLHVMSSLSGFEALLRNVPVTVWGRPWYAGWGLTDDRAPIPRRVRRLSLDELVAGGLILYSRYADPVHAIPCTAEDFMAALAVLRRQPPRPPAPYAVRQLQRLKRKLLP